MNIKKLDFSRLEKFIDKFSVNNLLKIIFEDGADVQDVRLTPILTHSIVKPTVLKIYQDKEIIYIEINVFKIKIFAHLENKWQQYVQNENLVAIDSLEYGIKSLLYRYVFGVRNLQLFFQKNIYISHGQLYNISNIINNLYKLLSEKYRTTINHKKKLASTIKESPTIGGVKYIGNIHLGGLISYYINSIKVKIIFLNENSRGNNITEIVTIIRHFQEKIQNNSVAIKLYTSVGSQKQQAYVNHYHLPEAC